MGLLKAQRVKRRSPGLAAAAALAACTVRRGSGGKERERERERGRELGEEGSALVGR